MGSLYDDNVKVGSGGKHFVVGSTGVTMYNTATQESQQITPLFQEWNISDLGDVLCAVSSQLGAKIPGVNSPYLYFGMWRTTFPWHVEDMDLYSINYLHYGAPKFWYSIPQSHATRFETMIKGISLFISEKPCNSQNCWGLLRSLPGGDRARPGGVCLADTELDLAESAWRSLPGY